MLSEARDNGKVKLAGDWADELTIDAGEEGGATARPASTGPAAAQLCDTPVAPSSCEAGMICLPRFCAPKHQNLLQ